MSDQKITQVQAGTLGMFMAMQSVLRAIIATHPDIDELVNALKREGEETHAVLLSSRAPDEAIDAFRDAWNSIVPFADSGPSRLDPRI